MIGSSLRLHPARCLLVLLGPKASMNQIRSATANVAVVFGGRTQKLFGEETETTFGTFPPNSSSDGVDKVDWSFFPLNKLDFSVSLMLFFVESEVTFISRNCAGNYILILRLHVYL